MSFLSRLFGCTGAETAISPRDYVARRSNDDVVIDVRTPGEYSSGHLAGATNVNVMAANFAENIDKLKLDTDRPVYLYCRSGNRSQRAAQILRSKGFENAYNIGGYNALVTAGAPSERR